MSDGYFTDDSLLRRVNSERALALAGPRALLMQVAHPLAVSGLLAHSTSLDEPYARLARTAQVLTRSALARSGTPIAWPQRTGDAPTGVRHTEARKPRQDAGLEHSVACRRELASAALAFMGKGDPALTCAGLPPLVHTSRRTLDLRDARNHR
jgi:ER-bound oxygenase mpaB/B'/Rubber oxygenase, catalytic domain